MGYEQHNFEELEVWKRSSRLAVSILELIEPIKLYALRDQMARSCISVPSNISEGAERDSNREFRRFLAIAKGSIGELRTQLYIGLRAGVFDTEKATPLIQEAKVIGSMLEGLRRRLLPLSTIKQKISTNLSSLVSCVMCHVSPSLVSQLRFTIHHLTTNKTSKYKQI